jgi:hypothetical protein
VQLDKLSSTYLSTEALHPTSDDFSAASDNMSASETFHVSNILGSPHAWAMSDPSLTTGPAGQADRGRMQKCINNRDLYTVVSTLLRVRVFVDVNVHYIMLRCCTV